MPVSASELPELTCEDCAIFSKCLFARFPSAHGWSDRRYLTDDDKANIKKNPNGRYETWKTNCGATVCPLFVPKSYGEETELDEAMDYIREHPEQTQDHDEDMNDVCSGCYLWGKCLIQRTAEANDSGGDEQGCICPMYKKMPTARVSHSNRHIESSLKEIQRWCNDQLKGGSTTKEEFDSQVVKFKVLKGQSGSVQTAPSFSEIQDLLIQVFGGIANGDKQQ